VAVLRLDEPLSLLCADINIMKEILTMRSDGGHAELDLDAAKTARTALQFYRLREQASRDAPIPS
jgi:hypothetical protein